MCVDVCNPWKPVKKRQSVKGMRTERDGAMAAAQEPDEEGPFLLQRLANGRHRGGRRRLRREGSGMREGRKGRKVDWMKGATVSTTYHDIHTHA